MGLCVSYNQSGIFFAVQMMIVLPRNFDIAGKNDISIISLPYPDQLSRVLKIKVIFWGGKTSVFFIITVALQGNFAVSPFFTTMDSLKDFISGKMSSSDSTSL